MFNAKAILKYNTFIFYIYNTIILQFDEYDHHDYFSRY
jgi:hypothetical protein